jgi:hypothetical protein
MEDDAQKHSGILVREKLKPHERRQTPRHAVNADSQVEEPRVHAIISGRMTDLGLGGCYVDAMMTFPIGTNVVVRLTREDLGFEANARIVFSKPGLGMGLEFLEMEPAHHAFLTQWVGELAGNAPVVAKTQKTQRITPLNPSADAPTPLQQLITLLMRKGNLNQSEYELLLREIEKNQNGK